MKTPWLPFALSVLFTAASVACAVPNATFCESDDQCPDRSQCDPETNRCVVVPSPDAGNDLTEVAPEDSGQRCRNEGGQCLNTAPVGWLGPLARADARSGDILGDCQGPFPSDAGQFGSEITSSGSCSCDCDSPSSMSCSAGSLTEWTSPNEGSCEQGVCDVVGGSCSENTQTLDPGSCRRINTNLGDEPFLRATFGQIVSATCAAPEVFGALSSDFELQTQLCDAELAALDCRADEVCVPDAPTGFDEELCIARTGEHECPEALGYTERTLVFTGIDDNRECGIGSCSCSAPTGSCGGKIELHNGGVDDDLCNAALATLERASSPFGADNLCQSLPATATTTRYVIDPDDHSCRVNGSAEIAGSAVGTGVTTLCCMP